MADHRNALDPSVRFVSISGAGRFPLVVAADHAFYSILLELEALIEEAARRAGRPLRPGEWEE